MNDVPLRYRYLRLLSIAGSDSGGGAGIQADLKTFAALGAHGMTAISALTAQNTLGISAVHAVPAAMLAAQLAAVLGDIGADAVKIGLLPSPEAVEVVAAALRAHAVRHVVLDPVMVASSGDRMAAPDTLAALVELLFPLASLVTPNLGEAGVLLGRPVERCADFEAAVVDLLALGAPAVLLKGGHLRGDGVADLLAERAGPRHWQHASRIPSRNLHGTGCTLSAAIATLLARGQSLPDAVGGAHRFVQQAIGAGADVRTGAGHGPLNHGHAPQALCKIDSD